MADQKCPRCKLINPSEAERCDCGFDFISGKLEQSYLPRGSAPTDLATIKQANRIFVWGWVLFGVGSLITIGSLLLTPIGGQYTIAYGSIIVGLILIFRGAAMRRSNSSQNNR